MNSPNPFVPQGSLLELQSKRRSRLKVAVFCVLAVSVTGLTAMLIQGCKREQNQAENQPPPPPFETNETTMNTNLPPPVEASNQPVPPPVVTPPPVVAAPPVTPAVPETAATQYIVVKGDSLWKIAKQNGVTVKAIEAANPGVSPARLRVGQKLAIPTPTSAAGSAPPAMEMTGSSSPGGGGTIYIVKSGDTLSKIARRYSTTVKAIESENGLSTTRIKVGQKLKIPAQAETRAPAAVPANSAPAPLTVPPATDNTAAPSNPPGTQ